MYFTNTTKQSCSNTAYHVIFEQFCFFEIMRHSNFSVSPNRFNRKIINFQISYRRILHRVRRAAIVLGLVTDADCAPVHHIAVPLLHTAVEIVSRQTDDIRGRTLDALVFVLFLISSATHLLSVISFTEKPYGCLVLREDVRFYAVGCAVNGGLLFQRGVDTKGMVGAHSFASSCSGSGTPAVGT